MSTDSLMSLSEVMSELRASRSKIYWLIGRNGLPRPVKIGRSNFWLKSEVDAWLAARPRAEIAVEG